MGQLPGRQGVSIAGILGFRASFMFGGLGRRSSNYEGVFLLGGGGGEGEVPNVTHSGHS